MYEVAVPEGTQYAAIRCFSRGKMMMHVDDVEYIPQGEASLILKGYNIWLDGVRVNQNPVTETMYKVPMSDKERHFFAVTAVYDKGESGPSNTVETAWTGVNGTDTDEAGWSIVTEPGQITVFGAIDSALRIFTADGKQVASISAGTVTPATISPQPGIYIINGVGKTIKAIVPYVHGRVTKGESSAVTFSKQHLTQSGSCFIGTALL